VFGIYALRPRQDGKTPQLPANATAKLHPENPPAMPFGPPPELPAALRNGTPPPKLPANLPKPEELREQFALLQRFLELPPERLARIRESIESIERMPADRKAAMLQRIKSASSPAPANMVSSRFPGIPPALQGRLDSVLRALPESERTALLHKLSGYNEQQRAAFVEGLDTAARSGEASPWGMGIK
jgi:hypothetical protein